VRVVFVEGIVRVYDAWLCRYAQGGEIIFYRAPSVAEFLARVPSWAMNLY